MIEAALNKYTVILSHRKGFVKKISILHRRTVFSQIHLSVLIVFGACILDYSHIKRLSQLLRKAFGSASLFLIICTDLRVRLQELSS